ncbi:MAG TPA: hypothetical protein VFB63_31705, partial [Bryobacteraceae bacterium]|nr:hypothetical protein [Bryobacteraceae bacterium]
LGSHSVWRISPGEEMPVRIAGTGVAGFSGDDGPAIDAQLSSPTRLALDVDGNLFIADSGNNRIRRIDSTTGVIHTFAGNGEAAWGGDEGPAAAAGIAAPEGIALDRSGKLYVSDTKNGCVRQIDLATNVIRTVVFELRAPAGLAIAPDGSLYIADAGRHQVLRYSHTELTVTEVAGQRDTPGPAELESPAELARFTAPSSVAITGDGQIYIADTGNHAIRLFDPSKRIVTKVAGVASSTVVR